MATALNLDVLPDLQLQWSSQPHYYKDGWVMRRIWISSNTSFTREDVEIALLSGKPVADGVDSWIDQILMTYSSRNIPQKHYMVLVVGAYCA